MVDVAKIRDDGNEIEKELRRLLGAVYEAEKAIYVGGADRMELKDLAVAQAKIVAARNQVMTYLNSLDLRDFTAILEAYGSMQFERRLNKAFTDEKEYNREVTDQKRNWWSR